MHCKGVPLGAPPRTRRTIDPASRLKRATRRAPRRQRLNLGWGQGRVVEAHVVDDALEAVGVAEAADVEALRAEGGRPVDVLVGRDHHTIGIELAAAGGRIENQGDVVEGAVDRRQIAERRRRALAVSYVAS
jgi:hypothetical protein